MRHSMKERFKRLKAADRAYEYAADVLKHWYEGGCYGYGVAFLISDGVNELVGDMVHADDIHKYFGKLRNEHDMFLSDQVWENFVSCNSYKEFKKCIQLLENQRNQALAETKK